MLVKNNEGVWAVSQWMEYDVAPGSILSTARDQGYRCTLVIPVRGR